MPVSIASNSGRGTIVEIVMLNTTPSPQLAISFAVYSISKGASEGRKMLLKYN